MFRLCVRSVALTWPSGQAARPTGKVFLDVSSEGEPPRRFYLGHFDAAGTKDYDHLTHLTHAPVTLKILQASIHDHFQSHTLYDFLHEGDAGEMGGEGPSDRPPRRKERLRYLTFTQGTERSPVFRLALSISPVRCSYRFSLDEVTCLSKVAWGWGHDYVFCVARFNISPHAVAEGPSNQYYLGKYKSSDSCSMYSSYNATFATLGSFSLTFYVRTRFSQTALGEANFWHVIPAFDPDAEVDETPGALLFQSGDVEKMILLGQDRVASEKLNFYTTEGGGYEIAFSLTKDANEPLSISAPQRWHKAGFGYPDYLMAYRDAQERDGDAPGDGDAAAAAAAGPVVVPPGEQAAVISSKNILSTTYGNRCEVLIDGLATFERYLVAMRAAQHSISILAWELSLSFGLALADEHPPLDPPVPGEDVEKWITLRSVLLSRALAGVKTRIMVWRHPYMSYLNRLLYLGNVTIDYEVWKLERRCESLGLSCRVFHSDYTEMARQDQYSFPRGPVDADIQVVIVGNPKGVYSSHHEKLVLIDGECPDHALAFVGGFDMARGRYDQPAHVPPPAAAASVLSQSWLRRDDQRSDDADGRARRGSRRRPSSMETGGPNEDEEATAAAAAAIASDSTVQPLLRRIRFLWHDHMFQVEGPIVQRLHLHFAQRWVHAFRKDTSATRRHTIVLADLDHFVCRTPGAHAAAAADPARWSNPYADCSIRLSRIWSGVVNGQFLFDDFVATLSGARRFLYIEHQYPFQNYALTHCMCEALRNNPDLLLVIITPVATDLPSGIVGELFDWSQDHINDHLYLIYNTAPDRVGVYGLLTQDSAMAVKPIYVHAKVVIADDEVVMGGSTNMDNMSFFRSSELSITIRNRALAVDTRLRLLREHLGGFYRDEMATDFRVVFDTFRRVATFNDQALHTTGELVGRPIFLAPAEYNDFITAQVDSLGFSLKSIADKLDPRTWMRALVGAGHDGGRSGPPGRRHREAVKSAPDPGWNEAEGVASEGMIPPAYADSSGRPVSSLRGAVPVQLRSRL